MKFESKLAEKTILKNLTSWLLLENEFKVLNFLLACWTKTAQNLSTITKLFMFSRLIWCEKRNMDQKTLMNLEMFYPPFPKKVQFDQHTYVEPNFEVVFPVFRCCPDHSIQQINNQSHVEEALDNRNQKEANDFLLDEHQNDSPWFGEPQNNNEFDIYMLDEHENDQQILDEVIQQEEPNKNEHTEVDVFVLEEEPPPPQSSKIVKREVGMDNHNQDHGEMDDFVLDEPVIKNQQNWLTFLRRNLVFDVIQKSLSNFKKAIDNLRAIHPRGAGIVFCMSRKECDEVATTIGDDARPFHMDIADRTRGEFLQKWMDNEVLFLCATNALDKLNIDKRNVRFVLHHTLPQSLQIYEKQCAYAGHDDLLAHCVLFYNFNDHLRVARLMREDVPKPPANVLRMKEKALWDVLHYGENVAECRRKFLANYFGQKFNSDHCILHLGACTICEYNSQGPTPMQLVDFTHQALAVMWSMNGLKNAGVAYVADLFRGHITKKSVKKGIDETDHGRLPLLGMGRELLAADALRFIQMLVIEEYLKLRMVSTKHGTVIGYVEIGKRGREFMRKYNQPENVPPNERICLYISPRKEKRRSSSAKGNNSENAGTSHIDDDFYYDDEEEVYGMPSTSRMRLE